MESLNILQTEPLSPESVEWLTTQPGVSLVQCASDAPEFDAHLCQAHGLVIRTYTKIHEDLLKKAPNLKVVGRAGVGFDNIDVLACRARGVEVVHTPDANTPSVVEYVLAHILDRTRPREPVSNALTTIENWQAHRNQNVASRELAELTLGIYGFGRIGQALAKVASAFGMTILYHDLLDFPAELRCGATPVTREAMLTSSDIVTIHVDGRPSNTNLIGTDAFDLLKSNAIILNASRGMVVDPEAAAEFLIANPDAFGVFDVHQPEPFDESYPLLSCDNVKLTSHIAGRSRVGMIRMSDVVRDVYAVLKGKQPQYPVQLPIIDE